MEKVFLPFYYSWRDKTECLSDEEFGKLVRALLIFSETGERVSGFSALGELAFSFITDVIERAQKKQEQGRESAKKRWQPNDSKADTQEGTHIGTYVGTQRQPTTTNTNKNKNININTNENTTPPKSPSEGESRYAERFAKFWAAYPRKVGKGAAEKAFMKIKPSEELLGVMLRAIERQKLSEQWVRQGGQFIPHPTTWLNQERWRDEPPDDPYERTPEREREEIEEARRNGWDV